MKREVEADDVYPTSKLPLFMLCINLLCMETISVMSFWVSAGIWLDREPFLLPHSESLKNIHLHQNP